MKYLTALLIGFFLTQADQRDREQAAQSTSNASRVVYVGAARHSSGLELELAITLSQDSTKGWVGTIDIPLRDAHDLPLSKLVVEDGTLHAVIPGARSMQIVAELDLERGRLSGELRQGEVVLELNLERDDDYDYRAVSRPQHPVPPFPYRTRELVAQHPAGHTLSGTLSLPEVERFGPGPYATAVLISGGGREDRDSSALGHKPFLVIADHLTRKGLAVFRFDDRGVGRSRVTQTTPVGKDATSLLLATDTAAVVRRLRREAELAPEGIGLIGHSEGGMIAPLVTLLDPDVAFLVLLAGPGAPGAAVFRKQFELEWELQGADKATVERLSTLMEAIQAALVLQQPTEQLLELEDGFVDAWVAAGLANSGGDPKRAASGLRALLRQFDSPWWRFAFGYDPAPILSTVRCPILALNGDKDRQVWHTQNLDAIEAAVRRGRGDVTAIHYPNRNHLFQPTETGAQAEYVKIEITFDEGVLDDMIEWLSAKELL